MNFDHRSDAETPSAARRTFLTRAFGLLAMMANAPSLAGTRRPYRRDPMWNERVLSSGAVSLEARHLPYGYHLVNRYVGRPDGFGGEDEVALWYKSTKHADADSYPLAVFVSSNPQHEFALTEERVGEPLALDLAAITSAVYYDGIWTAVSVNPDRVLSSGVGLRWDRSVVNQIVAKSGPYSVGIRGSKLHGAGRDELILVLQSLA